MAPPDIGAFFRGLLGLKGNLRPVAAESPDWSPGKILASLEQVYGWVTKAAEDAISWYLKAKTWKKRLARWSRFLVIVLVALAGLLPVLAQIDVTRRMRRQAAVDSAVQAAVQAAVLTARQTAGTPADTAVVERARLAAEQAARQAAERAIAPQERGFRIPDLLAHPAWAAVLLALAAGLVALDRFFGGSSGWIRFIEAEMQLRSALDAFRLDWQRELAGLGGVEPDKEKTQALVALCRDFMSRVNTIVLTETNKWITEFQASLRQVDEAVQARTAELGQAAATVVVTNGDESPGGWKLFVDETREETHHGKSAAVGSLWPGLRAFRVEGRKDDGTIIQAGKAVTLKAGEAAVVELTLA